MTNRSRLNECGCWILLNEKLGTIMSGKVDPQMQQFILAEKEKQKFQVLVASLTDECWEKCVEKVGSKQDSKTGTCIVNCVERFLDTSSFVANRFNQLGES